MESGCERKIDKGVRFDSFCLIIHIYRAYSSKEEHPASNGKVKSSSLFMPTIQNKVCGQFKRTLVNINIIE